ncbi:MAG TPA: DUF2007 domain-containing protein [Dehalococcoidales bacterium]
MPKGKPGYDNSSLVYIGTAPNEIVAGMWAGILEENGISAMLKRGTWSVMLAFPVNVSCDIYVLASTAVRAREILRPFVEAESQDESRP